MRAIKARQARITTEMTQIFRWALSIKGAAADAWEDEGGRHRELSNLRVALHRLLGLKLWDVTVFDHGIVHPRVDESHSAEWHKVRALRVALEEAAEEAAGEPLPRTGLAASEEVERRTLVRPR